MRVRSFAVPVTVGLLAMLSAASCTTENKATKVGSETTAGGATGTTAAASSGFKVGDIVKLGSTYQVVVHSFKDPQPPANQFSKPAAGSHFVSTDLEVFNLTTKPQQFSILLGVEIQDAQNRTYQPDLTAGLTPSPPDGEISPKSSKRGFVSFTVPDGTAGLKLRFKGEIFSSGTAVIKLS